MFDLLIPLLIIGFVLYRLDILKPIHIRKTFGFIQKVILSVYNESQKQYKKEKVTPLKKQKINTFSPKIPMSKTLSVAKWSILLFLGIIGFFMLNPFVNIDAGHRGIVFDKLRGGVQTETFTEGLHFRIPFFQSISQIPIRTQKIVFSNDSSGKFTLGQNVSQRS